jgi:hypothetical protein
MRSPNTGEARRWRWGCLIELLTRLESARRRELTTKGRRRLSSDSSMAHKSRSHKQMQTPAVERYVSQLDLFAREFKTEAHLRKVIADLFRKMGHTGVRITHGPNEKGKDIIFYSEGPLGERRLFACVVKNESITGQADDHTRGAPTLVHRIQGVLNQIESAFGEPLPNGRGAEEWVDCVYVISPYECTSPTIESVKTRLQRGGQISFKCGSELLDLFAKHWREFLWFESTILLSYLSALRKGLEEDYALATLILQKSYMATSPGSLSDLYVEPMFHRELRQFKVANVGSLDLGVLAGHRTLEEVTEAARSARRLSELLRTAPVWAQQPDATAQVAEEIRLVGVKTSELWQAAYRKYIAQLRDDARQKQARATHTFASSGAFTNADIIVPSQNEASVELLPSIDVVAHARTVQQKAGEAVLELRNRTSIASNFSSTSFSSSISALESAGFLTYCQIAEAARLAPQAFDCGPSTFQLLFDEELLDRFSGSLLVTAPAGFGKTTFCRWHAIRDANRLVQRQAAVLPVYRTLHPLSRGPLRTFEEAFFPTDDLKTLIKQQAAGQSPFERIRLYLDGLDEVTSFERQQEIVSLAEQVAIQWPFVQIILTARDHVSGRSLRWLPRIRLSKLSDTKIRLLAQRWLEADRVDSFFERLQEGGNLVELMRIPLLATLILAVYSKTGSVPPNKTNLYTLFVELLCGGWDFYKSIQRRSSSFGVRDKEVVLGRLAGILQNEEKRDATDSDFRSALKNSISARVSDWEEFLEDIVEDGLLVRVGTALTFSHLSFQEFLAARDLRDHMGSRPKQALSWYLNGKDWWREVLAFYVTLSDRPGETDEWLLKRAIASSTPVADLEARVQQLRSALKAAFPAYNETSATAQLFGDLKLKAQKLGQKTVS